jgi:hypothetical protein
MGLFYALKECSGPQILRTRIGTEAPLPLQPGTRATQCAGSLQVQFLFPSSRRAIRPSIWDWRPSGTRPHPRGQEPVSMALTHRQIVPGMRASARMTRPAALAIARPGVGSALAARTRRGRVALRAAMPEAPPAEVGRNWKQCASRGAAAPATRRAAAALRCEAMVPRGGRRHGPRRSLDIARPACTPRIRARRPSLRAGRPQQLSHPLWSAPAKRLATPAPTRAPPAPPRPPPGRQHATAAARRRGPP